MSLKKIARGIGTGIDYTFGLIGTIIKMVFLIVAILILAIALDIFVITHNFFNKPDRATENPAFERTYQYELAVPNKRDMLEDISNYIKNSEEFVQEDNGHDQPEFRQASSLPQSLNLADLSRRNDELNIINQANGKITVEDER